MNLLSVTPTRKPLFKDISVSGEHQNISWSDVQKSGPRLYENLDKWSRADTSLVLLEVDYVQPSEYVRIDDILEWARALSFPVFIAVEDRESLDAVESGTLFSPTGYTLTPDSDSATKFIQGYEAALKLIDPERSLQEFIEAIAQLDARLK